MTDRLKNIIIGLFVSGAIAIVIAMVLFLKPTIGDGKKIINVRFTNISGISVGTRVTLAGRPVGEVSQIKVVPSARSEPDQEGNIYLYQLTLKVDSKTKVFSSDEIAIRTSGLMGEKSVAILPKAPEKGKVAEPIDSQIVFANSTDAIENTFTQISQAANKLQSTVSHLDEWFEKNELYVTNAIKSFDGAMGGVESILGLIDNEKLVPAVKESVDLLNDNMELIKLSLNDDKILHKFASLADNLDQATTSFNTDGAQTLKNLNQISKDIAAGSGTVGRLVVGDDLYLRLASLMNKGETVMNDINHYGILFQYNKQWQKNRTKKASFLKSLDTPQEFRNYFEGEVDSMTTSIGRLSELMDRANTDDKEKILQSEAFKRNFAALLRQVQGLSDSLKLYNEGLIAESEKLDLEQP